MPVDELETCPYDPAHRILRSRMAVHLFRCEQNHRARSDKKKCPYDATHVIDSVQFQHHLENCPARQSVLHYKYCDKKDELPIIPVESVINTNNDLDEDWDADPPAPTYDPSVASDKTVYRIFMGLSKAKKKQKRIEHRRKVRAMEHEKQAETSPQKNLATIRDDSTSQSDTESQPGTPLRPPNTRTLTDDLKYHTSNAADNLDISKLSLNDSTGSEKTPPTAKEPKVSDSPKRAENVSPKENEWVTQTSKKKNSRNGNSANFSQAKVSQNRKTENGPKVYNKGETVDKINRSIQDLTKIVRNCLDNEQKFNQESAKLDKKLERLENQNKSFSDALLKNFNSPDEPLPKIGGRGLAQAYKNTSPVTTRSVKNYAAMLRSDTSSSASSNDFNARKSRK